MKNTLIALFALVGLGASVTVYYLLVYSSDSPTIRSGTPKSEQSNEVSEVEEPDPVHAADAKMQSLKEAAARVEHLDWIAQQDWARSDLPVFRKVIVGDPDEAVQLHAVEKAIELAQREGGGATSGVVRTTLASTRGNTRARGLRAARENPDAGMVPVLLELVDSQDPYATMALSALAYTDSEKARAKVFEVAQDVSADRRLRERAIALLAVTKEREARPMLLDLANGEDQSLARIATEVLRILNEG